jgi:hypothetical protein
MSFIRRRGQGDGQPRCTKQREKEAEEKGSQSDVSTGEARDRLQANAASPDATYRTDQAVDSGSTDARGRFYSGRFLGAFRGHRYAGDFGFVLDAAARLLMRGKAKQSTATPKSQKIISAAIACPRVRHRTPTKYLMYLRGVSLPQKSTSESKPCLRTGPQGVYSKWV